jgi:hypothetical protein
MPAWLEHGSPSLGPGEKEKEEEKEEEKRREWLNGESRAESESESEGVEGLGGYRVSKVNVLHEAGRFCLRGGLAH